MNESQKRTKAIRLINQADDLLREVLRLNLKTTAQFSCAIVDAQGILMDAIVYTDRRQTLLKK